MLQHARQMCHVCMQHVRSLLNVYIYVCVCVCVCVRERERERFFAANLQVYSALKHDHRQQCYQNKVNMQIGRLIFMT